MDATPLLLLAGLMALAACLYASVGHGGASAYLAIMALFAVPPDVMRPTALCLNLVVSGLAAWRFRREGQANGRLLAAFAVAAMPMAFIGGAIPISAGAYRLLVGLLLWAAAIRLFWQPARTAERPVDPPGLAVTLPVGAGLGLLAGLTGTGGGIFLSPLLILFAWETPRRSSGVAAGFIFLNSLAGLAGNAASLRSLPGELPILVAAVAVGGLLGSWLGGVRLPRHRLLQLLGLVLLVAGGKLVLQ